MGNEHQDINLKTLNHKLRHNKSQHQFVDNYVNVLKPATIKFCDITKIQRERECNDCILAQLFFLQWVTLTRLWLALQLKAGQRRRGAM